MTLGAKSRLRRLEARKVESLTGDVDLGVKVLAAELLSGAALQRIGMQRFDYGRFHRGLAALEAQAGSEVAAAVREQARAICRVTDPHHMDVLESVLAVALAGRHGRAR